MRILKVFYEDKMEAFQLLVSGRSRRRRYKTVENETGGVCDFLICD